MFAESWAFFVSGDYSWHCEPVDYSDNKDAIRVLSLGWWYFFSKFVDLLDTVFFIMRKKFGQVSSLHVIHHSTLPWLSWWGPRFVGGGQAGFGPFLNSGLSIVEHSHTLFCQFTKIFIKSRNIFIYYVPKLFFNNHILSRCSHRDVFLLHVCGLRAWSSEISLVEEIHHNHPAGPVCPRVPPRHSANFLHMRLPQSGLVNVCR